jgi:hypothetical protein
MLIWQPWHCRREKEVFPFEHLLKAAALADAVRRGVAVERRKKKERKGNFRCFLPLLSFFTD